MEDIGLKLQETREKLGLTLEEVERSTRIRMHHLEAMERGDLDALPSPVQARGFLRNYAVFLGLPGDEVLLKYAEELQARRTRSLPGDGLGEPTTRPTVQVRSRRPRWLSSDLFVAAAITLAVVITLIWGAGRVMTSLRERTEAAQEFPALLASSETATPTVGAAPVSESAPTSNPESVLVPPQLTPTETLSFPLVPSSAVDVRVLAERRAWVRVIVDGEQAFQGRLAPGEVFQAQGETLVEVTTGSGGAVRIFYNGQDLGLMGVLGEVVTMLWTQEGAITPTPTQTTTPATPTPPAETPTPAATP